MHHDMEGYGEWVRDGRPEPRYPNTERAAVTFVCIVLTFALATLCVAAYLAKLTTL